VSTHIINKSLQRRAVELSKYFVVETQEQERLADYVRRVRNEKGFSLSKVEKNSGSEIDASYINRIENDLIRNVTPEKLSALAKGLEVSEDEIFAVARGKRLTDGEQLGLELEKLIKYYREVPRECQLDILASTEAIWRRRQIESRAEGKASNSRSKAGKPSISRVASPLHPPGWETQPGPGRQGEEPIFSAKKRGKKSRQA
jgi:transcriptional regulator with XRE-family HTH domain